VLAGQGGDAGAVAVGLPHLVHGAELGKAGPAPGLDAVCPGGGQAIAGEFVLQVPLELPDRDQDVDQHGGGRVGRGQIDDA
jgi:hypothetical protein